MEFTPKAAAPNGRAREGNRTMRRETIEMSYFARCHVCSELILAERAPPAGRDCGVCGTADLRSHQTNDNYFDVVMRVRRPHRRARRAA